MATEWYAGLMTATNCAQGLSMYAYMMRVCFEYVHGEPGERAKVTCVNKSLFPYQSLAFLLDALL